MNLKYNLIISGIASAVDQKFRKMGMVLGSNHNIFYFHPEPVEEILSSYQYISKSSEYVPLVVSIRCQSPKYENGFHHLWHLASGNV